VLPTFYEFVYLELNFLLAFLLLFAIINPVTISCNTSDIGFIREQTAKKLDELLRERRALDERIISLKQSLRAFDRYLEAEHITKANKYRMDPTPLPSEFEGLRELGLTDAVRKIVEFSVEPVSARQIREKLSSLDYGKMPKANPLAAIHAILTRLEKNAEIRHVKGLDKKPAYEWRSPISDLVDSMTLEQGIGFAEKQARETTFENVLDDVPRNKK
jgi:hypothetical protein